MEFYLNRGWSGMEILGWKLIILTAFFFVKLKFVE